MKRPKPKIALLRSIPGLGELGERDAAQLSLVFDERRVSAGTILARAGSPARELLLIAKGEATLTHPGAVPYLLGPGDFVGAQALLASTPHSCHISARTPMQILVAHQRSLPHVLSHPTLARHLATSLARRLQHATEPSQRVALTSTPNIADRSTVLTLEPQPSPQRIVSSRD